MKLSRRDALVALGAVGATAGVAAVGLGAFDSEDPSTGSDADPLSDHERETLVAVARELYPESVAGLSGFVETFLAGRSRKRPSHAAGVAEAVATLDAYCDRWWSTTFLALDREERDAALVEMGLGIADSNPDGTDVERVRYYVVDELLFALYSSPTGGALLGIDNPPGHPGGIESYRRGPTGE